MRLIIRCLAIGLLLSFSSSYALLNLELTQGVRQALPIAIVPFAGQDNLQAPDNVAAVVGHDLSYSGQFKVADMNSLKQTPHDNQQVDFNYWQGTNNEDLVVGKVSALGGNQYQVSFQLINLYAEKTRDKQGSFASPTLLSEKFTVNQSQLRGVAHHVSDLIYKKLTGERGIFSTKIAYVLVQRDVQPPKYSLVVSDIDGYNPRALMVSNEPIMSPAWSPSGKEIAYVSFEKDRSAIYIQNLATGSRRVVSDAQGINGAPAWSPNGNRLAFVLTKSGSPQIYIDDLANGQLTQLTDGYSINTEPNWAPDGKSIIFTSDRGGGPEIYQINLASRQVSRLTYNSPYNARASFTPGGNHIVMLTQDSNGYGAAIQNLQTSNVRVLTDSGNVQSPTVAPNGKMVAFADHDDGVGILGMVSTDGSVKLRIPAPNGDLQEPAWSPFLG
jgi:TolB protein